MKTIVTGGNGFIGSHLVKKLVSEGREVTVVTDLARLGTENLTGLGLDGFRFELVKADLTDYCQARRALSGGGSIYHLAAVVGSLTYLHGSATAELTALQRNLAIDANVFRVALEEGAERLVYASSVAVYPMERQASPGAVFREEDLAGVNPDGGYGWSKLAGEVQLGLMSGMAIGIARIFNIYGENEPLAPGRAHVVGDLMRKVAGGITELKLQGDGRQCRDFLYGSDCAEALARLEEKAASPALVVNIGSGAGTSIGDIARKIIAISGKDIKLTVDPSQPIGPVSRTADISRAERLLGWRPEVSLDEGLRRGYHSVERALAGSR